MNDGIKTISAHVMFPLVGEILKSGKKVLITVTGNSMLPLIRDKRDQVLLVDWYEASHLKGSIILFQDFNGNYILHRIYKIVPHGYRTIGDACLRDDGFITDSQIIGVVEKIYRKGKEVNCNSLLWRFIFSTWIKLLPIRKFLLNLYTFLLRLKHKVLNIRVNLVKFVELVGRQMNIKK